MNQNSGYHVENESEWIGRDQFRHCDSSSRKRRGYFEVGRRLWREREVVGFKDLPEVKLIEWRHELGMREQVREREREMLTRTSGFWTSLID